MCTLFDVNYWPKCGMWKVNFHPRLYSAANVFGSCSVFGHFPFSFVFRKMKHMLSWIQVRRLTWPLHNIWLLCLEKLFSWSNWLKMSSSSECLKKKNLNSSCRFNQQSHHEEMQGLTCPLHGTAEQTNVFSYRFKSIAAMFGDKKMRVVCELQYSRTWLERLRMPSIQNQKLSLLKNK